MTQYRPDIDGLRALAVLPVVLFHGGVAGFSGGFVGVDVFFVISGFLITSILTSDLAMDGFTLVRFYERRVRRLFPALFTVLVVTSIVAAALLMPSDLEDFGQSVLATALFGSNFLFWSESGYFEGPSELKPLLHTWSLAVEEQYYLVFPLLLKWLHDRGISYLAAFAVLGLASLAISVWSVGNAPTAGFFLLPGRFWELLLGAALAVWLPTVTIGGVVAYLCAITGLAGLGFAIVWFDESTAFPGTAALVPCLATACLIVSGTRGNLVQRLLAWRPLVVLGLISYSLYLWHFPVFVFAKHVLVRDPSDVEIAVLTGLSIMLAYGSWRYVEQPFRGRDGLFERPQLFRAAGFVIALGIGVGLATDLGNGFPGRLNEEAQSYLNAKSDRNPRTGECLDRPTVAVTDGALCRLGVRDGGLDFLLWGDSHANSLVSVIDASARAGGKTGVAALRAACAPLVGVARADDVALACREFNDAVVARLKASPVDHVVLAARWALAVEGSRYRYESGEPVVLVDAEGSTDNAAVVRDGLERTLAAIAAPGRRVTIVGPVPEVGWDVPNTLAKQAWLGVGREVATVATMQDFLDRNDRALELLREVARKHDARLVLPHEVLCLPAGACAIKFDERPLYFDTDHLTVTGAARLRPQFDGVFRTR